MKSDKLTIRRRYMTKRRIAEARKRLVIAWLTISALLVIWGSGQITQDALAEQPVIEPVVITKVETIPEMITRLALENNIEPELALCIVKYESNFNPQARNANSSASGLWQFISSTFQEGINQRGLDWTLEDRFDPYKSTDMAMWYLKKGQASRWAVLNKCK